MQSVTNFARGPRMVSVKGGKQVVLQSGQTLDLDIVGTEHPAFKAMVEVGEIKLMKAGSKPLSPQEAEAAERDAALSAKYDEGYKAGYAAAVEEAKGGKRT